MREKCKICNKDFTVLRMGSHIVQTHKINVQDYFEQYYGFPKSVVDWKAASLKDVLFAQQLLKEHPEFDTYLDLFQHIYDTYDNMREMDKVYGRDMGKICICLGVETNRNLSDDHKAKISKSKTGTKLSNEHKENISNGLLNQENKEERYAKLSESMMGHKHSRESIEKMIKNRPENNFRGKAGKREDLGDQYFRSRWEANYARILELKQVQYQFEPKIFWLTRSDGSEVSYTPDFYLVKEDMYVEVKGYWMDDAKEKFDLFRQQYPEIRIDVLDSKYYRVLEKQFKDQIEEWES